MNPPIYRLIPLLFFGLAGCASGSSDRFAGTWNFPPYAQAPLRYLTLLEDGTAIASLAGATEQEVGSWRNTGEGLVAFDFGDGGADSDQSGELLSNDQLLVSGPDRYAVIFSRESN